MERHRGSATAFHARPLPEPFERALWCFEVERSAVVLGSTQDLALVDAERARRGGVEVARRRSGGGAVGLVPGEVTWVDVLLPAEDPLADHDVSRSALWLGAAWSRALVALGVDGPVVHTGPMTRPAWSDLVCFAGLAPGEVSVAGRKVVGISQRRTRHGARFQCAVLHRWRPAPLLDVLALDEGDRARASADLAPVAVGLDQLTTGNVSTDDLLGALVSCLPAPGLPASARPGR